MEKNGTLNNLGEPRVVLDEGHNSHEDNMRSSSFYADVPRYESSFTEYRITAIPESLCIVTISLTSGFGLFLHRRLRH